MYVCIWLDIYIHRQTMITAVRTSCIGAALTTRMASTDAQQPSVALSFVPGSSFPLTVESSPPHGACGGISKKSFTVCLQLSV